MLALQLLCYFPILVLQFVHPGYLSGGGKTAATNMNLDKTKVLCQFVICNNFHFTRYVETWGFFIVAFFGRMMGLSSLMY